MSFVNEEEGAALAGQKGQIELVVGEGVEVFLPMAGLFDAGGYSKHVRSRKEKERVCRAGC